LQPRLPDCLYAPKDGQFFSDRCETILLAK
jgi:hypothetical protein